jgi:hypothetical protein
MTKPSIEHADGRCNPKCLLQMKKVKSLSADPSATSKVLHVGAGSCISSPIFRYDINGAAPQQSDDDIFSMPGSSSWSSLVVPVARLLVNRGCHDEKLFRTH